MLPFSYMVCLLYAYPVYILTAVKKGQKQTRELHE